MNDNIKLDDSNIKVGYVVCVFYPYRSGISEVVFEECRRLVKCGNDVTVFTPLYDNELEKEEIIEGIKIKRIKSVFKIGKSAFLFLLLFKLKNFDIVHLHYPFFFTAELIFIWRILRNICYIFNKNIKKIKLVYTYHMDVIGSGVSGIYFRFHMKFITPILLKCADVIRVSSLDYILNSKIKKFFIKNKEKFIELPFGASDNFKIIKQDKILQRKKLYNLNDTDFIILFVGGLDKAHYFKGLDLLIKSIYKTPEQIKLIIVGGGDRKLFFEKLVNDLGIKDRVIFTGRVSDDDLCEIYNICDLFVLPSILQNEAFGIVCVQAMACAKAVLASNLAGVRSVVDDAVTGFLVEPNNLNELTNSINRIFKNKDNLKTFGQNGYKKFVQKYNWDKIVNELLKIYKKDY